MRLARVAAGALVGVAVLAGCSNKEPASGTLPTPSSTAAASETLPPLGPADFPVPAAARRQTSKGAEEFVRYYIELINRAQVDLNTDYLAAFSDQCEKCDQLTKGLDAFQLEGYTFRGGSISINGVSAAVPDGVQTPFTTSLTQAEVQVIDTLGQPVSKYSTEESTYPASGGSLRWDSDRSSWLVTEFAIA
jgi:hypothetical protein